MNLVNEIINFSKELKDYIIEKRRDFHMNPELGYEEYRTSEIVSNELKELGYKVFKTAGTGVVGLLNEGKRYIVALRADMDALPINEENDVPYRSRVAGKMHACGHDAHTAMLLGAARVLSRIKDRLKGTIKLIFQPAEEGGLGAKKVVEEGVVDDVEAIFGLHVWSDLDSGKIGVREGPMMASADAFKVVIKGMGGHAASPHEAIDPIAIAGSLLNIYQRIVTREIDPLEPAVITVASINAGTTFNVIPERIEMKGTIRTFNKDVRDYIVKRMEEITIKYSDALRAEAEFELVEDYIPPTINDPDLTNFAKEVLKPLGEIVSPKPTMGAEDFSFYTGKTRGLYVILGIRNKDKGIVYPHHHPRFDVDEDVLWIGTAIYSILAYKYLESLT